MPKPTTFIALPMSIDQRKWHLVYSIMLTYFKTVILSVTLPQRYTAYNLLIFRQLHKIVTLCIFLAQKTSDEENSQKPVAADTNMYLMRQQGRALMCPPPRY